jgi:hypothetical protein
MMPDGEDGAIDRFRNPPQWRQSPLNAAALLYIPQERRRAAIRSDPSCGWGAHRHLNPFPLL